ncbi:glycerol-3-phosphate dehydrogenase [NAD(+)], cytoplasmic [Tetranychus urticae]|uniref:Glycerol-3-phosphate dehydrogenase [NAD(+)] n=1 Tax=Tetranychus urticae TaxID=32264 RepID=T1K010_TETUR|nr:glycerol-3-phosphate dehydrogenase [NAD(+)], cytoplasmic [Tetranychus urticae]
MSRKLLANQQAIRFYSSTYNSIYESIKIKLQNHLKNHEFQFKAHHHTYSDTSIRNQHKISGDGLWSPTLHFEKNQLSPSSSSLYSSLSSTSELDQTNCNNDKPRRVTVIGGGSWGSAISKVIAGNVTKYPDLFDPEIVLYLRDENLRLVIEKTRVNIRYLQIKLPTNIKPVSDLKEAISRSDVLIFAIPHEYIKDVCFKIPKRSILTPRPVGVSLIKGLHIDGNGNLERTTQIISRMLDIPVGALSGANVALSVAKEEFSEATLSPPLPSSPKVDEMLNKLFATSYFKISTCYDTPTVEICGALKNVISCGAGIIDGIGYGVNTKAAAIRAGIRESIRFVSIFHPEYKLSTFFENCGIADAIGSSFGGRNRKVIEQFVKSTKSLAVLEREILGGQKLQGPSTGEVVNRLLDNRNLCDQFPFFTTIHRICNREEEPRAILKALELSC